MNVINVSALAPIRSSTLEKLGTVSPISTLMAIMLVLNSTLFQPNSAVAGQMVGQITWWVRAGSGHGGVTQQTEERNITLMAHPSPYRQCLTDLEDRKLSHFTNQKSFIKVNADRYAV